MSNLAGLVALVGHEAVQRIQRSKILLVGAGGIGCELLKELVVAGFGEIHLVDLDTIDLSNLNRQFLFSQRHIKQPKAIVAAEVVKEFNRNVNVVAYHENILNDQFSPKWFASFDLAFNALDNAEARRHVNKMCVATKVPLIDCGTAGFSGQIQTIFPGESECYDCRTHPTPKSFPVCTIRSTPSQPIHCIVWAKSFLFAELFDATGSDDPVFDETETEDNKQELVKLKREKSELADLRESIGTPAFFEKMVNKIFIVDVERLLSMDTMWQTRKPPVPLQPNYDMEDGSALAGEAQKIWTVDECLAVLADSVTRLSARLAEEKTIEFDKDDVDTLDFVVAAANLRSSVFGIELKSKFDVQEIAGNIIPAIATTNAVVSGLGLVEALKIMSENRENARSVNIWRSQNRVLLGEPPMPGNPECAVCSITRSTLTVTKDTKLEAIVEDILKLKLGYTEVSLLTDRLLYDPDYEDNLEQTVATLNLEDRFLTIIDEDDEKENVELHVVLGERLHVALAQVPNRLAQTEDHSASGDAAGLKRKVDSLDAEDGSDKRLKLDPVVVLD